MSAPFDVSLLADEVAKVTESMRKNIASISKSHGEDFAYSVTVNVAATLMGAALAAEENEKDRAVVLLGFLSVLGPNVQALLSTQEAQELIARAMQKGRSA